MYIPKYHFIDILKVRTSENSSEHYNSGNTLGAAEWLLSELSVPLDSAFLFWIWNQLKVSHLTLLFSNNLN